MSVTHFLLVLIGLLAWDILKHLYRGAQLWHRHREVQQLRHLYAWRRARIAGARVTYPSTRVTKQPYLGLDLDVPQFVNRSKT